MKRSIQATSVSCRAHSVSRPQLFEYFTGQNSGRVDDAVPAYAFPFNVANIQAIHDMPSAVDGNRSRSPRCGTWNSPGRSSTTAGQATLEQVVEFYNRGGDFAKENVGSLDPDIHPLELTKKQQKDLVAFLKALTDERVRCEQAPFDHPQIILPNGAKGGNVKDDGSGTGRRELRDDCKAVGASGGNKCLKGFLE